VTRRTTTRLIAEHLTNLNSRKSNEEPLLRALADAGASISSILEAYTSVIFPFIKTDDINTTIWSTMGGKFTTNKTGFACDIFTPRVQPQATNMFF
jgi:hypothetical protein